MATVHFQAKLLLRLNSDQTQSDRFTSWQSTSITVELSIWLPRTTPTPLASSWAMGMASFGVPDSYPAGYSPDNIAVGDFNGDGLLDLAIANRGDGSISILLNTSKHAAISLG